MPNLPLNPAFESERIAVPESMELSKDRWTAFMGRQLRDMTHRQAFVYRDNNPDIWNQHLILDGMTEEEFREGGE